MPVTQEDRDIIDLAAAHWVVRSQADAVGEADIVALTEWLEASDHHADAYRRALSVWLHADEAVKAEPVRIVPLVRPQPQAKRAPQWLTYGLAGAVAAGLVVAAVLLRVVEKPVVQSYATAKGQRQQVTLSDGTVIALNTDTRLLVRYTHGQRSVILDQGEAALSVIHDVHRPFTVTAGGVRMTDLGTEFDVRRDGASVRVAVKSGTVSLEPAQPGGQSTTLAAGQTAVQREDASSADRVTADAVEAFAWQNGHAIYHDEPLSAVVKDLNRYFGKPIVVDEETGRLPVTAVITLDSERAVVRRLEDFLSLKATETDSAVVLRRPAGRAASS